jgi:hypothetical protein
MARYNVSFSCGQCGRFHPTKVFLTFEKDFAAREKLSLVYKRYVSEPDTANSSGTSRVLELYATHGLQATREPNAITKRVYFASFFNVSPSWLAQG